MTPEQIQNDPTPPIVLRALAGGRVDVNGAEVPVAELSERLKRMFAAREDHVLFFDADDAAEYGFAVEVLDRAREGGAVTIAPLTRALTSDPPAAESPPGVPAP